MQEFMKTRGHGIKRQGDWETRRYGDGDYKNIKTRRQGEIRVNPRFQPLTEKRR